MSDCAAAFLHARKVRRYEWPDIRCELVDDVQHPEFPAFIRAILDKVVGPDMVRSLGAKTDAGSIPEPKPAALRLFGGNL